MKASPREPRRLNTLRCILSPTTAQQKMEQRLDSMHSSQYVKSDLAGCVFRCGINYNQDLCDGCDM